MKDARLIRTVNAHITYAKEIREIRALYYDTYREHCDKLPDHEILTIWEEKWDLPEAQELRAVVKTIYEKVHSDSNEIY